MDYLEETYKILQNSRLQIWTLIATITSTVLWGIYVYFTIKTFNQIKKQTDLQSRAFLLATPKVCKEMNIGLLSEKATYLTDKWHKILENNLPNSISEKRLFELELTNRGKSDIVSWEINLFANIEQGIYLKEKFSINGEVENWKINSTSDQIIAPNQTIKVPIIIAGYFPKMNIKWDISYTDLMEGTYKTAQNETGYKLNNLIAYNYKE